MKKLKLISDSSPHDPAAMPVGLGQDGQALWRWATKDYDLTDVGGVEMLGQICHAKDMVIRLRALIDRDGEIVQTKMGSRENPLLKQELAYRAFIVRGLQRLGLNFEPLRSSPGRPPGFA